MTPQQNSLLAFIASYQRDNDGITPSYREMARGLGLSSISGIGRLIDALCAENRLRRGPTARRSLVVVKQDQPVSGWQPIETAPRDGSTFVTADFGSEKPEYEVGWYDPMPWISYVEASGGLFRRVETIVTEWRGHDNFHRATHWMPLPAPPAGDAA